MICGYIAGRIEDGHKLTVDWSIRKALVLRLARENTDWDTAVMPSAGLCRVAGLGSGFAQFKGDEGR